MTMSKHPVYILPDRRAGSRQRGLSIVEMMIAITLSLLLLAGLTGLLVQQNGAHAEIERAGKMIENGRYAMTVLRDDVQNAGFYGQYSAGFTAPASLPDPCATDPAVIDAPPPALPTQASPLALPVQGYDAPTTVPSPLSGCLADANHLAGTDILVVRRVDTTDTPTPLGSVVPGQIYIQATPLTRVTGSGSDPSVFNLTDKSGTNPADLRAYVEHIYFISPCNVLAAGATTCTAQADGGHPVPTLKRLDLTASGGAATFTVTPLAEGIQNLQIDYGIDSNGDGSPAVPFVTAPALADWPKVMAVQINLLARNTTPTVGYVDAKTYNMGAAGSVGPFADAYKRHVYTATVRLINPSGQKE